MGSSSTPSLRQSCSDWIVFDSEPTSTDDVAIQSQSVPDDIIPSGSVFTEFPSLGKRESFGQSLTLNTSSDFIPSKRPCWRVVKTLDEYEVEQEQFSPSYHPTKNTQTKKQSKNEFRQLYKQILAEEKLAFLSLQSSSSYHIPPSSSYHSPPSSCNGEPSEKQPSPSDPPVLIEAKITFHTRLNGNRPWETSCVQPEKIGKMRFIEIQLSSSSVLPRDLITSIHVEEVAPILKKGKLLICLEEKGGTGKTKRIVPVGSPVFDFPAVSISSGDITSFKACIKPEWGGCGENKEKQKFMVTVNLYDVKSQRTYKIMSWDTQIQSHKFESSKKGRRMEEQGAKQATCQLSLPF